MYRKQITIGIILAFISFKTVFAQDSLKYTLMMRFPVFDYPENLQSNYRYPSMEQALQWSSSLYDLSFWGIHETSTALIKNKNKSSIGKIAQKSLEYILGLAFSKYGSELPIPLGVWAHEAYHCSVLGTAGLSPVNGNSLFHRWDGTVFGLTDEELSKLKNDDLSQLLYTYVAGVQYEINLTKTNVLNDFYNERKFYKTPLYLYNAWYVYDYFRFSTSAATDSVKILAPPHEDADPYYRDFAGADLTAWNYDKFSPEIPFENRDTFPNGDGVNRRIGFNDLTSEGQEYLNRQKKLSLLNFINPAIFFINNIKVSNNFSFLPFVQYAPTNFGNCISLNVPMIYKQHKHLISIENYNNYQESFWEIGYGFFDFYPVKNKNILFDATAEIWQQPANQNFFAESAKIGASLEINMDYFLSSKLSFFIKAKYKTDGWQMGSPYLESVFSFSTGISFFAFNR